MLLNLWGLLYLTEQVTDMLLHYWHLLENNNSFVLESAAY